MKDLTLFWEHFECPSLNGIYFPDGRVCLLDVTLKRQHPVVYDIKTRYSSMQYLEEHGLLNQDWNSVAVLSSITLSELGVVVICGEGNYGTDGFVSVHEIKTNNLVWLTFLDCSNPFDKIDFNDNNLYITSTLGCVWCFHINKPDQLSVICK